MSLRCIRIASLLAAFAAGGAHAIDLVQNGSFSPDLSGWTAAPSGGATVQRDTYLGSPDSGSLRLNATGVADALATQCVDVHAWLRVDFVIRRIRNSEYGDGQHDFHADIYDADGCAGNKLDTITPPESGTLVGGIGGITWTESGVYDTVLPVGARSALISLRTSSGPSSKSEYLLDDVRLGPLDVIFANAFEAP